MKRVVIVIAAMLFAGTVCFSQTADFYGVVSMGGSLPVGNFGKATVKDDEPQKWGLADESQYGGAGIGANVGIMGAKRISGIEELSVFLSAEFFFNPLNKALRDYKEQYEVANINSHDKYEQRFPVYFNIPVLAGCRYDIYTRNRDISIFAELGVGANMRIITDHYEYWNMYKHNSEAHSYTEDYRTKFSFAAAAGAGAVFLGHIQVGIFYHYLGTARVISDAEVIYNNPMGYEETAAPAFSRGVLSPHMLSIKVGYLF